MGRLLNARSTRPGSRTSPSARSPGRAWPTADLARLRARTCWSSPASPTPCARSFAATKCACSAARARAARADVRARRARRRRRRGPRPAQSCCARSRCSARDACGQEHRASASSRSASSWRRPRSCSAPTRCSAISAAKRTLPLLDGTGRAPRRDRRPDRARGPQRALRRSTRSDAQHRASWRAAREPRMRFADRREGSRRRAPRLRRRRRALARAGSAAPRQLANLVRERLHGDRTYFNVNMRFEVTNVCDASCSFCAFAKLEEGAPGAHTMTHEQAWQELAEHPDPRLTELHMVNGLHPQLAVRVVRRAAARVASACGRTCTSSASPASRSIFSPRSSA